MKNKLFMVLLIFLVLFTSFSSVFASTDITYTDRFGSVHNFKNIGDDIDISNGYLQKTNEVVFVLDEGSYFYMTTGDKIWISGTYKLVGKNEVGDWVVVSTSSYDGLSICTLPEVAWTTAKIYSDSSKSSIILEASESFFIMPLSQVMKVEAKKQTIQITLAGLAKLLIPCLVCLLAFWKGWKFLSTQLKRA